MFNPCSPSFSLRTIVLYQRYLQRSGTITSISRALALKKKSLLLRHHSMYFLLKICSTRFPCLSARDYRIISYQGYFQSFSTAPAPVQTKSDRKRERERDRDRDRDSGGSGESKGEGRWEGKDNGRVGTRVPQDDEDGTVGENGVVRGGSEPRRRVSLQLLVMP